MAKGRRVNPAAFHWKRGSPLED